jgi:hypothetical protein
MLYYKATAGCGVGVFVGVSVRKRTAPIALILDHASVLPPAPRSRRERLGRRRQRRRQQRLDRQQQRHAQSARDSRGATRGR